jgi:hypothetical protein
MTGRMKIFHYNESLFHQESKPVLGQPVILSDVFAKIPKIADTTKRIIAIEANKQSSTRT